MINVLDIKDLTEARRVMTLMQADLEAAWDFNRVVVHSTVEGVARFVEKYEHHLLNITIDGRSRLVEAIRELDTTTIDETARLYQVCRAAYEVWAGSEGIPEPETAAEAYLLQLLLQMRDEVKKGLK